MNDAEEKLRELVYTTIEKAEADSYMPPTIHMLLDILDPCDLMAMGYEEYLKEYLEAYKGNISDELKAEIEAALQSGTDTGVLVEQSSLYEIAVSVADNRLNAIELEIMRNPDRFPAYVKAKKQEAQYENEIISVYGIDKMRLDKLVSSMIHTNNIVNAQVYISGFLDGGKTMHEIICHGASQTTS